MDEILFLDKDKHYTSTICGLLSHELANFSFFSFKSLEELYKYEKKSENGFCLLFFNMEEFDLLKFSGIKIKLQSYKSETLDAIYKFSPLSEFVRVISENKKGYENNSSELEETESICCVIGNCSVSYRNKILSDIILQKLKEGFIPIIAQICPNYQRYSKENNENSERNLSDFMMRIISGNKEDLAPGLYVNPMPDASLCFRSFQCTDDVYDCSADNIRDFVQIIAEWMHNKSDPMYFIIVLWSVPFSFIRSACIQSDKIFILNESDKSYNSQRFNEEISSLLSNLRLTVKINGLYEFCKGEESVLS